MAYLDPEVLLRQAGLLPSAPRPSNAGPLASLASVAPITPNIAPQASQATPEQAYNAQIQGHLNAAAEAARQRNAPPEEPGILEKVGGKYLDFMSMPANKALEAAGLVPEKQDARAGVAASMGAGGMAPGDVMTMGGGGGAAPAAARPMGGGGGGAPVPKEVDLLTPTQRKEYEKGMAMERDAATQGAERTRQALQLQEAAAHDYERNLQAEEAGRMRAEQTRADELRFRQQDYDDAVQQASKFKIDPMRSSKGGAWFGDMLGILMTGIAGKPELALNEIDKRINRDVDAQRAEYQALRDKASGAQNAYGMAMQRMGDARAAEKVTRDALAQQYATAMQRAAIGMKSADAENVAQKTMADLQSKYADDTLRFLKATPVGGGALRSKLPDLPTDRATQMPDGSWVIAPNHESKKELDTRLEGLAEVQQSLANMEALRKQMGLGQGPMGLGFVGKAVSSPQEYSALRDKLVAEQGNAALGMKKAGMSSDKDFDVLMSQVGNATSSNPGALGPLQSRLQHHQAQVGRYMQQNFFQAAPQVGMVPNEKTGLPEPKYIPGGQATPYGLQQARPGMPGSTKPMGAGGKK